MFVQPFAERMSNTGLSGSSHSIQPEDISCIVDSPFFEVSQYLFTSSFHAALRFLTIGCLTSAVSGILGMGKTSYPFCDQNETFSYHHINSRISFSSLALCKISSVIVSTERVESV